MISQCLLLSFMLYEEILASWVIQCINFLSAGGRLNKKDGLTRYGNSHVKDKTS